VQISYKSLLELWLFNSGSNILWSNLSTGIAAPLSWGSSELAYIPQIANHFDDNCICEVGIRPHDTHAEHTENI